MIRNRCTCSTTWRWHMPYAVLQALAFLSAGGKRNTIVALCKCLRTITSTIKIVALVGPRARELIDMDKKIILFFFHLQQQPITELQQMGSLIRSYKVAVFHTSYPGLTKITQIHSSAAYDRYHAYTYITYGLPYKGPIN